MARDYRFYEDNVCVPSDYVSVPISFTTSRRLDPEALKRGEFVEMPMLERFKDYDNPELEGIEATVRQFDTRKWQSFGADDSQGRAAGLVIARQCPAFDMLENRRDLAVVVDVRVRPNVRGKGLGRTLMAHALEWCQEKRCSEVKVETQDINVNACRFYAALGFHVAEVNRDAYPAEFDETQVIWRRFLNADD